MNKSPRTLAMAGLGALIAITAAGCKEPKVKRGRTVKATIATFDPNADVVLDLDKYGTERPDDYAAQLAFNQSFEGIDACVLAAKERKGISVDKVLKGDMDIAVKLDPLKGKANAVNATLPGRYDKDAKLKECIRGAVAGVQFPSYDGPPVVVEFSTELDAGSEWEDE